MYALAKRLRVAAESFEGQRQWHANAVDGDCEPHDSWQIEMDDGSKAAIEAACLIERLACSIAIMPYTSAILDAVGAGKESHEKER